MNHITLSGRVYDEPVYMTSQKGKGIIKFKLGVRRKFKNADGKYENDYFNVTAFGITADYATKNVAKDNIVIIEGEVQNQSWENNGKKYYGTAIIASSIEVPYGRDAAAKIYGDKSQEQQPQQQAQRSKQSQQVQHGEDDYVGMPDGFTEVVDENLPF